jgi:hypothetical protein
MPTQISGVLRVGRVMAERSLLLTQQGRSSYVS